MAAANVAIDSTGGSITTGTIMATQGAVTANAGSSIASDAITAVYGVGCLAQVDHRDFYLAPVVGVYGSRRVDQPDTMFDCQSATRTDLGFKPLGDRHCKTSGYQGNCPGL